MRSGLVGVCVLLSLAMSTAAGSAGPTTFNIADPMIGGLDTRFVKLPEKLGDEKSAWTDWKFDMENVLTLMDGQFLDDLHVAETETTPLVDTGDAGLRARSVKLYAILCSVTKAKAKQITKSLRSTRNGFEVW